jgi:hypothetical protein
MFPAVVDVSSRGGCFQPWLLVANKPTTARNTSTTAFIWKPEAVTAVWESSWWWA